MISFIRVFIKNIYLLINFNNSPVTSRNAFGFSSKDNLSISSLLNLGFEF